MKTIIITCLAAAALMVLNGCETDQNSSSPNAPATTQPTTQPTPVPAPVP